MREKFGNKGYKWEFENIGGAPRVKISRGEDLKHLGELDQKMWTVLSCPTKGLEIDEKSLSYIDLEGDGRIHIAEVISTAKWLTDAVTNPDLLLEGKDCINISEFNQNTPVGAGLYRSASEILKNLGKTDVIALSDATDSNAIFATTRFNGDGIITEASADTDEQKAVIAAAIATIGSATDRSGAPGLDAGHIETFYKTLSEYAAWKDSEVESPYSDKTEAALAAYQTLDSKVKDFFMRSRLASFSPDSTAALDVQTSRIEAISADNLTGKTDEIAAYPIARVTGKAEIDLSEPINPAWASVFETLRSIVFEKKKKVTEEDWAAVGASLAAYTAWKNSKAGAQVESLGLDQVKKFLAEDKKAELLALVEKDLALKYEADNIDLVTRFLYLFRDFFTLVKNFVTFQDFYEKDKNVKAIFQAGTLIIDQRSCDFCMIVNDTAKHSGMAAPSGMYLLYCDCVSKHKPGKVQIVAAITIGDVGDLAVGKNAIFYDRNGLDYDAVVTKIVDNPISIGQAFWSPYRRMANAIVNLINKTAADKDAKIINEANAKIATAPAKAGDPAKAAPQPFDIGKFAGIFAALGMALGMIGTALASLAKGILELSFLQLIGVFFGIILVISGPSMVLAWMKLRKRNISPLLNANGWAINSSAIVNIPFGQTLTDIAKFPKLKLKDPYAKKGLPAWLGWLISILTIAVVAAGLWLGNIFAWAGFESPLPWFDKEEAVEVVEDKAVEEVVKDAAAAPQQ